MVCAVCMYHGGTLAFIHQPSLAGKTRRWLVEIQPDGQLSAVIALLNNGSLFSGAAN